MQMRHMGLDHALGGIGDALHAPDEPLAGIETELLLADLESLEKRVPNLVKRGQTGDKESKIAASVLSAAISEAAPTNVVLPAPKPPAITIFTGIGASTAGSGYALMPAPSVRGGGARGPRDAVGRCR